MNGQPSWRGPNKGLQRFYFPQAFCESSAEVPYHLRHQLQHVLRLRSGDSIVVFDGTGRESVATLVQEGRQLRLQPQGIRCIQPPKPRLFLIQALIRPSNFELVVQKATELGVSVIQPVATRRTQPHHLSTTRVERWRKIAVEAAEQCGRADLPEILPPVEFARALSTFSAQDCKLIAYEREGDKSLASMLMDISSATEVALAVGPEGGFEGCEVDLAQRTGYQPVHLGPWRLRSETAAIAAISLIMMVLGSS